MSLRKRVEELESDVYMARLAAQKTAELLEAINDQLKQLKCPHTKLVYDKMLSGFMFDPKVSWRERCELCGKVIRGLEHEEYLLIEKERLASELKDVTVRITASKKK